MKKCMKCGMEMPDDSRFCNHCGQTVEMPNPSPASTYSPPAPTYTPSHTPPPYTPPPSYNTQSGYTPYIPPKKRLTDKPLFWVAVMAPVALLFIVIVGIAMSGGGDSDSYDPYRYTSPSHNGLPTDNSEDVFQPDPDNTATPQPDVAPQADAFDPGNTSLLTVPVPPSNRKPCEQCDSTGEDICISCKGTGKGTQNTMDRDLLDEFGLGGLQDTLNDLPCTLCKGSGRWGCTVCYGTGEAYNYDYSQYYNELVALADQTGMRIFALEDNQISPYLGFYYCKLCNGLGHHPELKVHETDIRLCQQCFSEGVRFEYLDSFTEEELYRDYNLIYDASVYDALGNGGGSSGGGDYDGGSYDKSGSCLVDGCTNPTAGGHPYCASHQAAPGPDFGVDGTGYCPTCGEKVYTTDVYCARCR